MATESTRDGMSSGTTSTTLCVDVVRADESLDRSRHRLGEPLPGVRDGFLDERRLRFLRLDGHRALSPYACGPSMSFRRSGVGHAVLGNNGMSTQFKRKGEMMLRSLYVRAILVVLVLAALAALLGEGDNIVWG